MIKITQKEAKRLLMWLKCVDNHPMLNTELKFILLSDIKSLTEKIKDE